MAGEASTLPTASTARTWNECLPFDTFSISGETQGSKPEPSRLHWKLVPGSDVNSNSACFFLVLSLGRLVIVVSGGVVSQEIVSESCVSSPKPSPSQSGSRVAAMSTWNWIGLAYRFV